MWLINLFWILCVSFSQQEGLTALDLARAAVPLTNQERNVGDQAAVVDYLVLKVALNAAAVEARENRRCNLL